MNTLTTELPTDTLLAQVASDEDTFIQVITDIKDILSSAQEVEQPIQDLRDVIEPVVDVLNMVDELATAFTSIDDAIDALDQLTDLLEAFEEIPIVGQVLGVINAIVEAFDGVTGAISGVVSDAEDLSSQAASALTDIDNGLGDVESVIEVVSEDLPDALTDIEILYYLVEMADVVVPYLKGTEPGDKLAALIQQFDAVRNDVEKFTSPLRTLISDVEKPVLGVYQEIQHAEKKINDFLPGMVGVAKDVLGELNTIYHHAQYLLDKIKPVAWALKKAECIEKKIIDPVIDEIMKVTHLDQLTNAIGQELADKLGFSDVYDLVSGSIGGHTSSNNQSKIGSKNGSATKAMWEDLSMALGNYKTNKSKALGDMMDALLSAIIGAPVKPNSIPPITNWPAHPALPQQAYVVSKRASKRLPELKEQKALLAITTSASAQAYVEEQFTFADSNDSVAQLHQAIEQCLPVVQQTVAIKKEIIQNLQQWSVAKTVPETFFANLAQLIACIQEGLAAEAAIAQVIDVPQAVANCFEVVSEINLELSALDQEGSQLTALDTNLSKIVPPLIAAFVQDKTMDTLVTTLNHWYANSTYLMNILAATQQVDKQMDGAFSQQIQNIQTAVEQAAAKLLPKVQAVQAAAQAVNKQGAAVNQAMTGLSSAFLPITQHSQLLRNVLEVNFAPAIKVLKSVDAFVDPLSALIKLEGCNQAQDLIETNDKVKSVACSLVMDYRKSVFSITGDQVSAVPQSIGQEIETILNIPQLKSDTAAAKNAMTLADNTISQDSSQLLDALNAFKQAIANNETYQITKPDGTTVNIPNQLLSETTMQAIQALVPQMAIQAQADGIQLPPIPVPPDNISTVN